MKQENSDIVEVMDCKNRFNFQFFIIIIIIFHLFSQQVINMFGTKLLT